MDILIKNMEMPKKGDVLELYLCSDGDVGYQDEEGLHKAKAVALPSHGRLIDEAHLASLIIADIKRLDDTDEYTDEEKKLVREVYQSCLYKLGITPTIVEASDE